MSSLGALFLTLGIFALAFSWVLLLIRSWSTDFTWGLCTLLLPPLSYFYGLFDLKVAWDPLVIGVAGWGLLGLAYIS